MILNICGFYQVDAVPFLVDQIQVAAAKLLLHIIGLVEHIHIAAPFVYLYKQLYAPPYRIAIYNIYHSAFFI